MKGLERALAGLALVGVLVLTGLTAGSAIGQRSPFFTRGEPREALVVQTIVRGEGFVLPTRNVDELPSKPPLFHWLAALSSVVQGRVTEGSIRFPGLVASLITAAATATVAWLWWGPATGALTAIVLVTNFQWLSSSVSARVDMILAAAITLALLLFAWAIDRGRRIPALAYALLTAATLTKGPVGLVLPCAIAVTTLALRGELRVLAWRDLRLLSLATAAAGVWYVAAYALGGDAFLAKQVLKENIYRVLDADAVGAGHVEVFWYYVPLLAAGLAPWSLFLPGLIAAAWTSRREEGATTTLGGAPDLDQTGLEAPAPSDLAPNFHQESIQAPHEPIPLATPTEPRAHVLDRHTLFAVVWGGVTFALFSCAGSKRAVYLLPAYPAYAMLVARAWVVVAQRAPSSLTNVLLAVGASLSSFVLAVVGTVVLAGALGAPLAEWLRGLVSNADANNVAPILVAATEHRLVVVPCCAIVLVCAWVTFASMRRARWTRVFSATALAMLVLSATVSTTLLPALAQKRSTRGFLARVEARVPLSSQLSFYRAFDYGAVFYRGAAIPVRSSLSDVPELDGAWLLTWPALLPALAEEARKLDTGGDAAGAYEVEEALAASEDVDPSDQTSLVLVRIVRRIGDEHSGGN